MQLINFGRPVSIKLHAIADFFFLIEAFQGCNLLLLAGLRT